jgi:hypothetical protein
MDLQTLLSIISIIVNIIGFFFIIKQITQQALATKGETYTSMCSLSYEILEMIFENPFLYDYFYNNKKLEEDNENKIKILICTEMIANYCDNVTLQRENMPDYIWQRWRNFIISQLDTSLVFREFMNEYSEWYSPEMILIINKYNSNVTKKS